MLPVKSIMSPSSTTLGLGDALQQQVEDELDERRRKLMTAQQAGSMGASARSLMSTLGSASAGAVS